MNAKGLLMNFWNIPSTLVLIAEEFHHDQMSFVNNTITANIRICPTMNFKYMSLCYPPDNHPAIILFGGIHMCV